MGDQVSAQTLALTYTKVYGLPLCRRGRPVVAWYGDMDMASHAWKLLGLGPLDAYIRIGPPVPLDRKRSEHVRGGQRCRRCPP